MIAVAALTAATVAAGVAFLDPPAEDASGPVILVVIDTLRADHLSQYGYDLDTSPGLAGFAAQATRFENAYAPTSWTRASVTSIMTGMNPLRHGVHRQEKVADRTWTMADAFAEKGWATGGFSLNPNVSDETGLDQGFDRFPELWRSNTAAYKDMSAGVKEALAWLDEDVDISEGEQPFLFFLPMNAHGPYRVPHDREDDLLGRRPRVGFEYYGTTMQAIMRDGDPERRGSVSKVMLESLQQQYDTAIHYTADTLGEFFEALKARELYDEATIIVTSDHGEELFEHGGFSHGFSLHDEVLHVPLFIKLPGQTDAATVSRRVALPDLLPTVVELYDLTPAPVGDGRSLVPLLEDPAADWPTRDELYAIDWPKRCVAQAVVQWPWKLLHIERNYDGLRGVSALYDLSADPGELDDVAAAHPERVVAMQAVLEEQVAALDSEDHWADAAPKDESIEERLRALGYVE